MRNTITLNGIASTTIAGLLIQELPAIVKPAIRTTIEEIDGRDGDIVTELGYSAYDKEITIGLYGSFDINAVIAYFATEGTVVFSNEPDKFYRYKIIDQIDYERLVRYRTATVKLHCQPFKYPTSETPVQLGSGQTVTAEGTNITMQGTALAPFVSITPKGDTSQQTYTGKNLFNINGTQQANTRCTATINGNAITVTSTAASTGFYSIILPNSDDLFGKTVTISFGSVDSNHKGKVNIYETLQSQPNSVGGWVTAINAANVVSSGHQTFTFPDSHTGSYDSFAVVLYVGNQAGSTAVGDYTTYSEIQIEAGSTATAFEPYVGGTASPNPDYPQDVKVVTGEQTVKVTGWQLCPGLDNPDVVHYNDTQTTYTPLTTGWCRVGYVADASFHNISIYDAEKYIKPNTVYTTIVELNNVINPGNAAYTVLQSHNQSAYRDATYLGKIGDAVTTSISIRTSSNGYGAAAWTATSKDAASLTGKSLLRSWIGSHLASGDSWDIRVSIIEGDHASDWQDYCDKRWQSYQTQEYKVNLGKNLLNPSQMVLGYVLATGSIQASAPTGDMATPYFIPVQPNTKVTFTIFETTSTYAPWFGMCEYSAADETTCITRKVNQESGITSATFTTGANTHYIRVSARNMAAATKYQLEYGDKTDYSPYFEPIELCKIGDYQDYFYKSGGNWYKHAKINKVTFDGSVTPNSVNTDLTNTTRVGWNSYATIFKAAYPDTTGIYSNYFLQSSNWNVDSIGIAYANNNGGVWFRANKTTIGTTSGEVVTWLTNHPVDLYFIKLTATQEQITDSGLIAQLEALANANSYRYVTKLNTAGDGYNMPVIIAATATGEADGTVTNAGNTYAKPKLTIYGTGNIGIYLNGSQMFQIELGAEGHITIDTEKMEAYKDSESNLKNRLVTGDYSKFRLEAGANQINFSGNINKCVVENYTRWL